MNSFNNALNKTLHQIYDVVDEPSKAKECVSLCSKASKQFPSVSLFSCVKALAMLRVSEEEENCVRGGDESVRDGDEKDR